MELSHHIAAKIITTVMIALYDYIDHHWETHKGAEYSKENWKV